MKIKIIFATIILSLFVGKVSAQSDINISNYWNENRYYINSAYINKNYLAEFSMVGRQQWTGFPGAPQSYFATARMYWEELQSQFGLKFFTEKHGYTSVTNATLSYTYNLRLNRQWDLRFALGGSYQNLSYDFSKMTVSDPDELAFIYNMTQNPHYYNADLGFELANKSFVFGASVKNLLSALLDGNDGKYQNLLINSNYAYVMYRKHTANLFDFSFGALGNQYENMYRGEFNATAHFKPNSDVEFFQVGLFFRTTEEVGFVYGINILPDFHVAYSYDYNFGNIRKAAVGTHELMLIYRINHAKKCRNCW